MNCFKNFIISLIAISVFGYTSVFAAGIDHFEVTLEPSNAKIGEAIDMTIEAVDKNNNVVTDYNGTILIFSESDSDAELPSAVEDNSYVFSSSDQGVIKFENSVKFKTDGTQDIHIYDLEDDTVMGVGEVQISKDEKITNLEIDIISPESGLTIGENKITISGSSQKNHTINILVNSIKVASTTTNNDGYYEKELTELQNGSNNIQTQVLNADAEIVGSSEEVEIQIESNLPRLTNLKVTPNQVEAESSYEVEVIANKGLTEVNIIVNDILTPLTEVGEGVYRKNIYSPKESGTFKIDLILKDELGHETTELGAGSIIVKEIPLEAPKIIEKEVELTITPERPTLKIEEIKITQLKTKSILTWNSVEGAESYNVYKKLENNTLELIENINKPRFEVELTGEEIKHDYFAVQAIGKTDEGEFYNGDLSEATKVQTGPEIIILLFLSLLMGGVFIVSQKRNA